MMLAMRNRRTVGLPFAALAVAGVLSLGLAGCGSSGQLTAGQVRKYSEATHDDAPGMASPAANNNDDAPDTEPADRDAAGNSSNSGN